MLPPDEPRASAGAICHDPLLAKDGRHLSLPAVYRYFHKGVVGRDGKRHRLEYERGPRGIVTSHEAVVRFIRTLNSDDRPAAGADEPPKRRLYHFSAKAGAAAECDAIGI